MNRHLIASASSLTLLATPIAAQQSAQVDAAASLEPATSTLSVVPENGLQFGRIAIPDKSTGGSVTCSYSIAFQSGRKFGTTVREFSADGLSTQDISGCEFIDSNQDTAHFGIECNPGFLTNFLILFNSASDPNIAFFISPGNPTYAFFVPGQNIRTFPDSSAVNRASGSVDGRMICAEGGAFDLLVGGEVQVTSDATPGSDLTVGSISVTMNY